eukprot:COSAG04_NODE_3103_length_3168_cov_23.165289_2_plen_59_part_00
MGDVPEDLVTLVNYLGSVKKKNFIVILRAAILVSSPPAARPPPRLPASLRATKIQQHE